VTALYELDLHAPVAMDAALATVRLRWKQPSGPGRDPLEDSASEVEHGVTIDSRTAWEGASPGYQRSVCVAQLAEILRRSIHARNDSLDELIEVAAGLGGELRDADHQELVAMMQKTRALILHKLPYRRTELSDCIDTIRRNRIRRCELEVLARDRGDEIVAELERENERLEARIRDLVRRQLEQEMR